MKMLGHILTISFLSLVFVSKATTSGPLPSILPKNFKDAPIKFTCERERPTAFHRRMYSNKAEGWIVSIEGKNKKDLMIIYRSKNSIEMVFIMIRGEWESILEITPEESQWLDNLAKQGKFGLNEEEEAYCDKHTKRIKRMAA